MNLRLRAFSRGFEEGIRPDVNMLTQSLRMKLGEKKWGEGGFGGVEERERLQFSVQEGVVEGMGAANEKFRRKYSEGRCLDHEFNEHYIMYMLHIQRPDHSPMVVCRLPDAIERR